MGYAMLFPEPDKGGRGKKTPVTGEFRPDPLVSSPRRARLLAELAIEVRDELRTFVLHLLQQWIGAINGQDRRVRPLRRRHFRSPGLR